MKKEKLQSCLKIQELLIQKEELTATQKIQIEHHLKVCNHCREYQKLLLEISTSIHIKSEKDLQPNPQILNTLKLKLKNQTRLSKSGENILIKLEALFLKKIPVYQAVLAFFIAIVLYFSLTKIDFSRQSSSTSTTSQSPKQIIQPVEFPAQLDLDQNHVGRSLQEDSVLTKFMVSIL